MCLEELEQLKKTPEKFTQPEYYFEYHIKENGRFNPYRDGNEIHPEAIYDIAKIFKIIIIIFLGI